VAHKILIIDDEDDIREVPPSALKPLPAGSHYGQHRRTGPGQGHRASARRHPARCDDARHGRSHHFNELRKNPVTAHIPVLLLTAKVQSSDQRRFADLGVDAVLFKPFDPLTLSTEIASVLGWK